MQSTRARRDDDACELRHALAGIQHTLACATAAAHLTLEASERELMLARATAAGREEENANAGPDPDRPVHPGDGIGRV